METKDIIRKEVYLTKATLKPIVGMALDNSQTVKGFIEAQLIAMGEKGVSYIELWYQCEAMSKQLKELSK